MTHYNRPMPVGESKVKPKYWYICEECRNEYEAFPNNSDCPKCRINQQSQ